MSRGGDRKREGLWPRLAVFQPFSYHAKGKDLCLCHRLVTRRAVCEYTEQLWDFGYPATVVFALTLDVEVHSSLPGLPRLYARRGYAA